MNQDRNDLVEGAFLRAHLISQGLISPKGERSRERAARMALDHARALAFDDLEAHRIASGRGVPFKFVRAA